MKFYYYDKENKKVGPFDSTVIRQLVETDKVQDKTVIETDNGAKNYAEKFPGIKSLLDEHNKKINEEQNDTYGILNDPALDKAINEINNAKPIGKSPHDIRVEEENKRKLKKEQEESLKKKKNIIKVTALSLSIIIFVLILGTFITRYSVYTFASNKMLKSLKEEYGEDSYIKMGSYWSSRIKGNWKWQYEIEGKAVKVRSSDMEGLECSPEFYAAVDTKLGWFNKKITDYCSERTQEQIAYETDKYNKSQADMQKTLEKLNQEKAKIEKAQRESILRNEIMAAELGADSLERLGSFGGAEENRQKAQNLRKKLESGDY